MKRIIGLLFLLAFGLPTFAQTAPAPNPNLSTFALTASALALPGNHQTVSGSVSGLAFTLTNNLDLREDNLIPAASGEMGFFGGFNYRIPAFSRKLNNMSSTLNGYDFQLYLTASLGATRINDAAGNTAQHYAGLAGLGLNYKLSSGGAWTLGFEARAARLPGMAQGWTALVSLGPTFHF